MVSSFGALRALLLAALLSPALSLPHPPAALPWKRNIQSYVDNIVYLDGSKSSLYCAVEANRQTYGGYLDNHWDGMIVKSDSSQGSTSQITVESVSVTVSSNHGTIAFMGEDIEIDYYTTSQWPSQWPSIDSSAGVGAARIGVDITNSKSVMNKYLAQKWSNILDNWYYDLFIFYDWMNTTAQKTEIDFAGIITTGTVFDWNAVLDISASDIKSWGLPDMSAIKNQPYIYLRNDGTFYIDDCLWVNGKQYTEKSRVSGTSSGSVVVDINLTERWSYFPDDIVKALYGSVSGSKYYSQSSYGYYQIPCDTKITFWFTIGGVKYTLIEEALIAPNPWGDQCIGSIFTYGQSSSWDITFGFQFLSSFYYRSGVSHSSNQPYAKLLPLPSPAQGSYGSSSDAWSWTKGGNGITYSDSGSNSNSGSGYSGSSGSGYQGSSGSSQSWGYQGGSYQSSSAYAASSSYYNGGSGWNSGSGSGGYNGNNGYQSSSAYAASSTYGSGSGSGGYNGWGSNNGYQSSSSSAYQVSSTYGSGSGSGSGWGNNNGGYNGYQSSSTSSAYYPASTYGSGSGWNNGNNYNSGSNYQSSQGGSGNGWGNGGGYQSQYTPSTTTTFTTVTHTNIGTTTVAWPTSGSGSGYSGSGSGSGSGYSGSGSDSDSDSYSYGYSYSDSESSGYSTAVSGYQGSHYSGSGSGYSGSGYANEDLKVAGNAAVDEKDENGNDLNLPHGSITDKLKHCLPAIIVVAALAGLGLVIGLITCLVRRRRNRDAPRGSSAYSTVHFKDVHEPVSVPLYGAEEGSSRYADPYKDKE